ncbi:hypothetical protein LRS73_16840 [Methylobacterium currus]|uniref:hypothetical protein n=1 Tax=Methylobacterium currus TaxID=2051553 RepID=UPI001E600B5D|nr:hypothetical protein [Methylobacterium currus]UHC14235.1 hypothetical protein LRS73_16840 [Methylobacterium currus]
MTAHFIQRLARISTPFAVLALIILSWLPGTERPHTGLAGQVEHFIAYTLTAAGIVIGFPHRIQTVALMLIGLNAVLEVGQIWIPGRTSQFIDFAASCGGIVLGLFAGYSIVRLWLARTL